MTELTRKQQMFVAEYLSDMNATAAAIRAGYSRRTARQMGAENLSKPYIAQAIAEAMERRAEAAGVEATRVLQELARIAFADMGQLFDAEGRLKPLSQLDADDRAAIRSLQITTRETGDGTLERKAAIQVWDKLAALEKLARHLGLFSSNGHKENESENSMTALIQHFERGR